MTEFIYDGENRHFCEHHKYPNGEDITGIFDEVPGTILFYGKFDKKCVEFRNLDGKNFLHTSYYIGVDWLVKNKKAIYIQPKLNSESDQTDYLKMLFDALRHPEIAEKHTNDLFEIKWDDPLIEITQQQDLLTPLLVVQFLRVVQQIVRKGLKKSYYKVEQNLHGKVKGKVLVSKTIKQNILRNKYLNTYCRYDEFGVNGLENRLLKKALLFVRRYLPTLDIPSSDKFINLVFNYVMPAFEMVSDEVSFNDVKHAKTNVFYKEYDEGIRLAKLLIKRFGYNITNTQLSTIQTPPFWIDMSKLFELYVLGLLKDRFKGKEVIYHFNTNYQELDYLINSEDYKMVVDAKYKTKYQQKKRYEKDDIRQVSGYARMNSVYQELKIDKSKLIDCLIIYPDQNNGSIDLKEVELTDKPIKQFNRIYKQPIKLPTLL